MEKRERWKGSGACGGVDRMRENDSGQMEGVREERRGRTRGPRRKRKGQRVGRAEGKEGGKEGGRERVSWPYSLGPPGQ